jgi:spoIIIJ-associated protein
MSSSDSIEVTASTIDEAISQALAQLGAEQDDVAIEVLSAPRSGVLGLGARPARVRVTRHAPADARSGVMSPPPAPPLKPKPPQSAPRPAPRPSPPQRPAAPRPPAEVDENRAGGIEPVGEKAPRADFDAAPEPRRDVRREPRRRGQREVPERGDRFAEGTDPRPQRAREPDDLEVTQPGELDYEREPDVADADAAAAASLREQARAAREILAELLRMMGEKAEIDLAESDDPDMLELNIRGDGSGLLIGRHGQTLDAIEYLVNRMLARRIKDAAPVSVDTESYRARRRRQLQRMALAKGEQAKREHVAVTLEPMPPRDRRIVHLALKDDPMIATRSSGEGFMRAVEIVPVDTRRETPPDDGSRRGRRDAGDRTPIGQQGGFKHGQKRIV